MFNLFFVNKVDIAYCTARRTGWLCWLLFFFAGFMVVVVGKETGKMNDDSRVFCEGEKKKKPTVYTVLHTLTFI